MAKIYNDKDVQEFISNCTTMGENIVQSIDKYNILDKMGDEIVLSILKSDEYVERVIDGAKELGFEIDKDFIITGINYEKAFRYTGMCKGKKKETYDVYLPSIICGVNSFGFYDLEDSGTIHINDRAIFNMKPYAMFKFDADYWCGEAAREVSIKASEKFMSKYYKEGQGYSKDVIEKIGMHTLLWLEFGVELTGETMYSGLCSEKGGPKCRYCKIKSYGKCDTNACNDWVFEEFMEKGIDIDKYVKDRIKECYEYYIESEKSKINNKDSVLDINTMRVGLSQEQIKILEDNIKEAEIMVQMVKG